MKTKCYQGCTPLASVSEFADDVKYYADSYISHAMDIPDEGNDCLARDAHINNENCSLDYSRDCRDDDCHVGGVVKYTLILQDYMHQDQVGQRKLLFWGDIWGFVQLFFHSITSFLFGGTPIPLFHSEEREALMFLVHLLHDLHQPLHCGRDSDNQGISISPVTYMGEHNEAYQINRALCDYAPGFVFNLLVCRMNLHLVWDHGIISKTISEDFNGKWRDLEDDIYNEYIEGNDEEMASWLSCLTNATENGLFERTKLQDCALLWANESVELALDYAYRNAVGVEIVDGTDLDEAYHERVLPVVRKRHAVSAVRLAGILERALTAK